MTLRGPGWPKDGYDRHALPERVLQFGTGALLRAVSASAVDTANRAGVFKGRIAVVQSTATGLALAINAQDGLFTLVEQGVVGGTRLQRARVIGAISRALIADAGWASVRAIAARPELQVIVSNVTEAGFRVADDGACPPVDGVAAPASFPAKLIDLLFTRYRALGDGPPLYIIPTELVPDNGPALAAMIDGLARQHPDADALRAWIAARVRFCSSLVDRITIGAPATVRRAELEAGLGYQDPLLTVTEPYSLWAIEGEPAGLRDVFPIDAVSNGSVTFTTSIAFHRERKLRLLNGAHTALAPLSLMTGVPTVRETVDHPVLGSFLRRIISEEIAPSTTLSAESAQAFAADVLDRFRNPWLDHQWQVIAGNQTAKLRIRVLPSITDYHFKRQQLPRRLVLALAASLRYVRVTEWLTSTTAWGWWCGEAYRIVDVELELIDQHWRAAGSGSVPGVLPDGVLERFASSALGDAALWGRDLAAIPGLPAALIEMLVLLEHDGVDAAVAATESIRQSTVPTE